MADSGAPRCPGFHSQDPLLATVIFVVTYGVIALGRVPGARLDRAGAALIGASLMVASGALTLPEAYRAIDPATLTLLLGMMIIVANLRFSGFFGLAALAIARNARHPVLLLLGVIAVSGALSAFLVNDTVCLMLTPLVAETVRALRRNVVPYLLAVAMASNIGSAATITGNPQNMIIGSLSHIPYAAFAAALSPAAALGLVVLAVTLVLGYRGEFLTRERLPAVTLRIRVNRALLARGLVAIALTIVFFFLGEPPAKVAIVIGALLLLTRRVKPERVYAEIDWALLLLFAGLFILVAGIEKAALTPHLRAGIAALGLGHPVVLASVTGALSNLVSNVPAVLVLKSFVAALVDPARGWLVLAMASTFAGNLTIVGSVANLIVVERARRQRIEIDFWSYLRVGAPVAVVTIALGALMLG
jgi:Na+/H+ antiporter NhaD/arsenite permease-like protein